jgi:hypothetical protein
MKCPRSSFIVLWSSSGVQQSEQQQRRIRWDNKGRPCEAAIVDAATSDDSINDARRQDLFFVRLTQRGNSHDDMTSLIPLRRSVPVLEIGVLLAGTCSLINGGGRLSHRGWMSKLR